MYKVMIVDDEIWIRKTIRKLIEDTGYKLEVACEARNGEEAIQLIKQYLPDIIVTDMLMPGMDGLALMDYIQAHYKYIKIIVISGYSDFEYMKKAISCSAFDYILKPVCLEDVKTALSKVISSLEKDREDMSKRAEFQASYALKREIFLQNLANARISNIKDIESQANDLKINLTEGTYCSAIFAFRELFETAWTKYDGNIELLMYSIENILLEAIGNSCVQYVFKTDDKTKLCIIFLQDKDENPKSLELLVSNVKSVIYHCLNITMIAGIGTPFSKLTEFHTSFAKAMAALFENPLTSFDASPCQKESTPSGRANLLFSPEDKRILSQSIKIRNNKELTNELNKFLERVSSGRSIALYEIHKAYTELLITIDTAINSLGCRSEIQLAEILDVKAVHNIISLPHLQECILNLSESIVKILDEDRSLGGAVSLIREVESYLKDNYFQDISLVDIACRYHFEPTYFSKLFKSVTNESFIEYITRIRLEKSCSLLKDSSLKISDIASIVGYENQQYFSQVFKKFTGLTPTEYRESLKE